MQDSRGSGRSAFTIKNITSHGGRHDEDEEGEEGGHDVVRILDLRVPLLLLSLLRHRGGRSCVAEGLF